MSYAALFDELEASTVRTRESAPEGLSEEQSKAWSAPLHESALICAGAGAGKTRLLVERVARLLKAGADPKRVAVVTFTKKSANEIATRVGQKVPSRARPVCATVHSVAMSLAVKQEGSLQLVTPEQEAFLLDEVRNLAPEELVEGVTNDELLLSLHRIREIGVFEGSQGLMAKAYEELLNEKGWIDFTSLLQQGCARKRSLFDYVLVDEAQDLSPLQLTFLQSVASKATFWFIGDPDQSIYAFRGSAPSMMHQLAALCTAQYQLTANYRCGQAIVEHANNVISANDNRFDIRWVSRNPEIGEVSVKEFDHGAFEEAAVRQWLQQDPTRRCALARTQALVKDLKDAGLPAATVHESKGLEWDEVWVLGCETGLFPHPLGDRAEERRLFYVAMTRAKQKLIMSYAKSRSAKKEKKRDRHPSAILYETQALRAKN